MIDFVTRLVGNHNLLLLPLYNFLQKYTGGHQRDVTADLAGWQLGWEQCKTEHLAIARADFLTQPHTRTTTSFLPFVFVAATDHTGWETGIGYTSRRAQSVPQDGVQYYCRYNEQV